MTEQELAETGWKDDEIKQSKFPVLERADVLGCFNGEELVSQFAVYPLDMNIYGERYQVGFVTSVCTYPEYTGNGIMKKLMKKSLTRMKESNKSFALLYPYSIPLYRRLGWEIISNKMTYVIKDTQVPQKISEPGYVRRVAWDDIDFKELHGMFATKTHGCLYRNKLGLWEYIHKHDSMIDEVRGNNYYSEPIAFELDDSDIKETIRPYAMGRIIDIAQFIPQYKSDPDGPGGVFAFEVSDELLPWNNGIFTIAFRDGKSSISGETPKYHLKMSIGTLTTLLMGYKTAEYLWNMGKIEGTAETVGRLDDVLLHEIPYVSDYI